MRQRTIVRPLVDAAAGWCLRRELDAKLLRRPSRRHSPHPHWIRRRRTNSSTRCGRRSECAMPRPTRPGRARTSSRWPTTRGSVPRRPRISRDSLPRCRRQASRKGPDGKTAFIPDTDLQPTTVFYWRARAVQGTAIRPVVGHGNVPLEARGLPPRRRAVRSADSRRDRRANWSGPTTFIKGRGIQLNTGQSYVRYLLPQTITNGEFSMDVEGLRANAPGDKAKVFGMQEGQTDFITNRYRVDIQYRGTTGFTAERHPVARAVRLGGRPEAPLRARHREAECVRAAAEPVHGLSLEGDLGQRLPPRRPRRRRQRRRRSTTTVCRHPGARTRRIRITRISARRPAAAAASPPSIAGTIYRNVWLSTRPRPESLGQRAAA